MRAAWKLRSRPAQPPQGLARYPARAVIQYHMAKLGLTRANPGADPRPLLHDPRGANRFPLRLFPGPLDFGEISHARNAFP